MNILEGEMVRLRALEPEDIDILYRWENDTTMWEMSHTVAPFSRYILKRFIENQRYDIYETRQMRLIIEAKDSNHPIGAIDLFDIDPYNRRACVGILVYSDNDRGQGYASSALGVLIRYAFQVLGLNQIYCNVLANNPCSLNLFKGKGFHIVGIKAEWIRTTSGWADEYMLQLVNNVKI